MAVLFESIPLLAGKFGDVVYFFFWMAVFGLVVAKETTHGSLNWARCFDFTGFGFMIEQMQQTLHTESVAIGSSPFDPTKTPIDFAGLTLTRAWILPRTISILAPLFLLPLAGLFFHRFDPARTGKASEKTSRNWIGKLQSLFKPLSRRAVAAAGRFGRGGSLGGAIWMDAFLTFTLFPLALVALLASAIATLVAPLEAVLPAVFATLAIVIADVATRDERAGTTASLRAIPRLRENYVWWKLGSVLLLSLLFCAATLVRTIPRGSLAVAALLGGIVFVSAAATALGVVSSNPKTFVVGFLSFWYVVVNDRGAHPLWDFAGFYQRATLGTIFTYAGLSVLSLVLAQVSYRARLTKS